MRPRIVKAHSVDRGQDVHRYWRMTKPDRFRRVREISDRNPFKGCAKGNQSIPDGLRVLRIRSDENIEVFGRAGLRVQRYRVASDDQVLNAVGVEGPQQFSEVWEHPAGLLSWHRQSE